MKTIIINQIKGRKDLKEIETLNQTINGAIVYLLYINNHIQASAGYGIVKNNKLIGYKPEDYKTI